MLQLPSLNRAVLDDPAFRAQMVTDVTRGPDLERHVDDVIGRLRVERRRRGREAGGLTGLSVTIDDALRTDAVEHMDDPNFPERGKFAIAQGLHLLNTVTFGYVRLVAYLEPMLREAHARLGRPVRVLELAAGTGGFAFALAKGARRRGLSVEVTGSDIVPLYVSRAKAAAEKTDLPLTFKRVDALDMSDIADGAYDIAFIAQSVHHFSPGQLARMVAECRRIATTAFVSVDGHRSLGMVGFVVGTAALAMWPSMIHDATISARKFYSAPELAAIAQLGAPGARVQTGRIQPLLSTLTARFDAQPS
jgi:SAM-dependent methyltransferase